MTSTTFSWISPESIPSELIKPLGQSFQPVQWVGCPNGDMHRFHRMMSVSNNHLQKDKNPFTTCSLGPSPLYYTEPADAYIQNISTKRHLNSQKKKKNAAISPPSGSYQPPFTFCCSHKATHLQQIHRQPSQPGKFPRPPQGRSK